MSQRHAAPSLLHRPSRGLVAALLGFALAVVGGFAVVMSFERLRTGTYPFGTGPDGWLGSITWASTVGWVIAIVAVLLGILLLVLAWNPGRRNGVVLDHRAIVAAGVDSVDPDELGSTPTRSGSESGDWEVAGSRQVIVPNDDLERWLRRNVADLDGVANTRIRVSRRRISVVVTTSVADPNVISDAVTSRLRDRVDSLNLHPNPALRVRLR